MFLSTLQILFELDNIFMGVMGSIIGIIFGAIPGLSGTTAMALLLPVSFSMDSSWAAPMLARCPAA